MKKIKEKKFLDQNKIYKRDVFTYCNWNLIYNIVFTNFQLKSSPIEKNMF